MIKKNQEVNQEDYKIKELESRKKEEENAIYQASLEIDKINKKEQEVA